MILFSFFLNIVINNMEVFLKFRNKLLLLNILHTRIWIIRCIWNEIYLIQLTNNKNNIKEKNNTTKTSYCALYLIFIGVAAFIKNMVQALVNENVNNVYRFTTEL